MPTKEQEAICHMFDRIAPTYDQANRFLSFGQDIRWRKKFSSYIPKSSTHVLDVATGTGDLLLAISEDHPHIVGVGVDLAKNMLALGQEKIEQKNLGHALSLKAGDAANLPFDSGSFDVVTCAFGIRNVQKIDEALKEMLRVLKPGGQAMILEFSLPAHFLVRWPYLLYFRYILPILGGMISKDKQAYQYLNRTVEAFPTVSAFSKKLSDAGFYEISPISLTLGVATIYCARK